MIEQMQVNQHALFVTDQNCVLQVRFTTFFLKHLRNYYQIAAAQHRIGTPSLLWITLLCEVELLGSAWPVLLMPACVADLSRSVLFVHQLHEDPQGIVAAAAIAD